MPDRSARTADDLAEGMAQARPSDSVPSQFDSSDPEGSRSTLVATRKVLFPTGGNGGNRK